MNKKLLEAARQAESTIRSMIKHGSAAEAPAALTKLREAIEEAESAPEGSEDGLPQPR